MEKRFGWFAIVQTEQVFARGQIQDALVNVHGTAGFARNGFGHESGVHVVTQRGFTNGAFEEKHLICQAHRVVMEKIDFHLPRANFMDQCVDIQAHLSAVFVELFKQGVKFIHCVNAVGLSGCFGAATATDRRAQQRVGVGVAGQQIKLQLGRHHWPPALRLVQIAHMAQHTARCKRHELAVAVITIVDDLCGRVRGPRHDAHGGRVGHQMHVAVMRLDHSVIRLCVGEIAGHTHGHHSLGQAHAAVLGEFFARQYLPARHARQVRYQAFDLGHTVLVKPLL